MKDFFLKFFIMILLGLLLKVTKVTTEHQELPKMGKNNILSPWQLPSASLYDAWYHVFPADQEILGIPSFIMDADVARDFRGWN